MSRISPSKHLLFYVGIIGTVLVLFQWVSAYGETHLKAPPNLNGHYVSSSAPPGCPESDRLVLILQQSGIYLNGSLKREELGSQPDEAIESEEKPTISGLWQSGQINLLGTTPALTGCGAENLAPATLVVLEGTVTPAPQAAFSGQLKLGESQPWQFSAQRQVPTKPKPTGSH